MLNDIDDSLLAFDDKSSGIYYGNCDFFTKNEFFETSGEIALWRAVLLQMFVDLKIKSNNKKYVFIKRKAYEWFFLQKNKEDIKEVCKLAGYEYRKVKKIAELIVEQMAK